MTGSRIVRRRLAPASIALGISLGVALYATSSNATGTRGASAPSAIQLTAQQLTAAGAGLTPDVSDLARFVKDLAVANGDAQPGPAVYARVTRRAAEDAVGSGRAADGAELPVYFVILSGHFVANSAPHPSLAPAPSGTQMEIAVDMTTGQVLDFGIDNGGPTIAKAGAVAQALQLP